MASRKGDHDGATTGGRVQLPRDALRKIKMGASFAEYDTLLPRPGVFVTTPATLAAKDPDRQKYFFVGRRGTGKTATSIEVAKAGYHTTQIYPAIFSPSRSLFDSTSFLYPKQKPCRSLVVPFCA
jgi:hypothetical protein